MVIDLRDIQQEDKEVIRGWRNSPEVSRYMYTNHYITFEEHEKWFRNMITDQGRRYWIITMDQIDVGVLYLYSIDWNNKRCHWGFYLGNPDVRGKGIGGYAEYLVLKHVFEELGFNKLCCEVIATNRGIIEMHKRFYFVEEGYFRQHVSKNGQFVDVVCLGILKKEWELKKAEIEEQLKKKGLLEQCKTTTGALGSNR